MSEERNLWEQWKGGGDLAARDALAAKYLPFVRRLAVKEASRLPRCVELGDLICDGHVGLIDAMEKFDPAAGVRFTTFAYRRIRGQMVSGLREMDWVPRLVRERGEEVVELASTSIVLGYNDAIPVTLGDIIPCKDRPEHRVEEDDEWEHALARIADGRSRRIAELYFRHDHSMRAVGEMVGLSEARTSQILAVIANTLFPGSRPTQIRCRRRPRAKSLGDQRLRPVVSDQGEWFKSAADASRAVGRGRRAVTIAICRGTRVAGRRWFHASQQKEVAA